MVNTAESIASKGFEEGKLKSVSISLLAFMKTDKKRPAGVAGAIKSSGGEDEMVSSAFNAKFADYSLPGLIRE